MSTFSSPTTRICRKSPDCFGASSETVVWFDWQDQEFRARKWEVRSRPRTRPPWLDRAVKWLGW